MARTSDRNYIARSGTSATNTTTVALAAGVAKTVVAVLGGAATSIALARFRVSFDGVSSTAVPAVVEVGIITALGTMTSFTPVQVIGHTLASSCTAGYNATVEPTYNRIVDSFYAPVLMGHFTDWIPLGEEVQCDASQGLAIRVTAPAATVTTPAAPWRRTIDSPSPMKWEVNAVSVKVTEPTLVKLT